MLDRLAADMPSDREALKDFVASLVKGITLDPYEIPAPAGEFMASPRGFEPRLPP